VPFSEAQEEASSVGQVSVSDLCQFRKVFEYSGP